MYNSNFVCFSYGKFKNVIIKRKRIETQETNEITTAFHFGPHLKTFFAFLISLKNKTYKNTEEKTL